MTRGRFTHPTALLLAALCVCVATAAAQPDPEPSLGERIDAYLQPFIDAGHLSGYLLVARGNETLYERGFGRADYELDVPVVPETRFCVASINKPMTVAVAIRLLEQGKLGLQDPVGKWLPDFPRGDQMTVEHLLRHRAGIPHRLVDDHRKARAWTAAELVEEARKAELAFAPGTEHSYSSGGFSILARILELAGGKSYEELLEEYLFRPAGMTETAHGAHGPLIKNRARSYFFGADGGLVNAPPRDLSHLIGAGAAYSTARDLLAMMRAVLDGKLGAGVRDSLVDENGLDWNGLTHGFRAFADYHQASDTFVILTANIQSGAGDLLRRNLPKIVLGAEPEPPPDIPAAVEVPLETLASYQGTYQLRPGRTMPLRLVDGALRMDEWLLIPTGETMLFSPQDYGRIRVVRNDTGAVERLDWLAGGREFPMPRVGDLPTD